MGRGRSTGRPHFCHIELIDDSACSSCSLLSSDSTGHRFFFSSFSLKMLNSLSSDEVYLFFYFPQKHAVSAAVHRSVLSCHSSEPLFCSGTPKRTLQITSIETDTYLSFLIPPLALTFLHPEPGFVWERTKKAWWEQFAEILAQKPVHQK